MSLACQRDIDLTQFALRGDGDGLLVAAGRDIEGCSIAVGLHQRGHLPAGYAPLDAAVDAAAGFRPGTAQLTTAGAHLACEVETVTVARAAQIDAHNVVAAAGGVLPAATNSLIAGAVVVGDGNGAAACPLAGILGERTAV